MIPHVPNMESEYAGIAISGLFLRKELYGEISRDIS